MCQKKYIYIYPSRGKSFSVHLSRKHPETPIDHNRVTIRRRHRYAITPLCTPCMRSCRAPIASLDCMEEFNGGGGGGGADSGVHCSNTAGTKEQLLTSCIAAQAQRLQHPSPGIRYRNLGKSGLRVSNVGLGTLNVFPRFSFRVISEIISPFLFLYLSLAKAASPSPSWLTYICLYMYTGCFRRNGSTF